MPPASARGAVSDRTPGIGGAASGFSAQCPDQRAFHGQASGVPGVSAMPPDLARNALPPDS
eukprot:7294216-Alexandrium_andersonii.AAC.1